MQTARRVAYRVEPLAVLAFGVAWLFFVSAMLYVSSQGPAWDGQPNAPATVTLTGVGDDVSIAFDASAGDHLVAHDALCHFTPVLTSWSDGDAIELGPLPPGVVSLAAGTYFVSVTDATCEWRVLVSPM